MMMQWALGRPCTQYLTLRPGVCSGADGRTSLHIAASRTSQEAAELLLKHGADINGR